MLRARLAALRVRGRDLLYGFLVLPSAVVAAFIGLAFLLTWLDRLGGRHGIAGFGGDASAARSILSTIATALITVAGLTFSITIVTLQLVSQQFSPRAMRNFLGDRVNQIVAGAFVGMFAYCLLVLRTVRQGEPQVDFVPGVSVSVAIALGVLTLALLLVFIHHMSRSIQLSSIARRISDETAAALETLYPEQFDAARDGAGADLLTEWRRVGGRADVVRAPRPGFVQTVQVEAVGARETIRDVRLHVAVTAGDFVTRDAAIVEVWDGDGDWSDAGRAMVTVANERDVAQDIDYGLRQLADIAIRALSPGVNDPTTAVTCIGYLQDLLERLAARRFPMRVCRLSDRGVVALLRQRTFDEHLENLTEVAAHARDIERVRERVLTALRAIESAAREAGATERARAAARAADELVVGRVPSGNGLGS